MPPHTLSEGWIIEDNFSCCGSREFKKWAGKLPGNGSEDATGALIAKAYGIDDPFLIDDIRKSIMEIHNMDGIIRLGAARQLAGLHHKIYDADGVALTKLLPGVPLGILPVPIEEERSGRVCLKERRAS